MHHHVVDGRPVLPAVRHRVPSAGEPGGQRRGPDAGHHLVRQPAAGAFGGDLVRLEHVVDEPPGALGEALLLGGQLYQRRHARLPGMQY